MEGQGLGGGDDAAVGDLGVVGAGHGGSGDGHAGGETVAEAVGGELQEGAGLVGQRGGDGAHVDEVAGLDGVGGDVELGHRILKIVMVGDGADAADDGGRVGDYGVAADGEEVGAAGGEVEEAGDAGLVGGGAEAAEFLGEDVAGGELGNFNWRTSSMAQRDPWLRRRQRIRWLQWSSYSITKACASLRSRFLASSSSEAFANFAATCFASPAAASRSLSRAASLMAA